MKPPALPLKIICKASLSCESAHSSKKKASVNFVSLTRFAPEVSQSQDIQVVQLCVFAMISIFDIVCEHTIPVIISIILDKCTGSWYVALTNIKPISRNFPLRDIGKGLSIMTYLLLLCLKGPYNTRDFVEKNLPGTLTLLIHDSISLHDNERIVRFKINKISKKAIREN